MRLVVTGGAGFIGSSFIRYRLHRHPDDEVVSLDLLTYAADPASLSDVERAHPGRYTLRRGDIADVSGVTSLFEEFRPDVVVNFAAESHNSRAIVDPGAFMRTNALGTQSLLEGARRARVERFHHISTCEVYGDLALDSTQTFSETSPYRPRTPYNASKAAADMIVRAYHETFSLPVTISNCSNNYGPWQFPEKVIPLFVTSALLDEPLPLYRHSRNKREWLHVDDHCAAIELILERGTIGETYNVGSGDERSIDELADLILEGCGKPTSLKRYVEDRPGHDRRYLLDHSKITTELGWSPRVAFPDGLESTIAWYREHRDWWGPKRQAVRDQLDEARWSDLARSTPAAG